MEAVRATGEVLLLGLMFAGAPLLAVGATSDVYPGRPVRLMAHSAGSTPDFLARSIAPRLSEKWGQPVVVDNTAGAGGVIASKLVATANPDGQTLVLGHAGTHVSVVATYSKPPYDPIADFARWTPIIREAGITTN